MMYVNWYPEVAIEILKAGGEKAIYQAANYLLDESRKQVPHDQGILEGTGTALADGFSATVSYDTPYAIRWHEHNANFQRGRKMKYLEDPCNSPAVKARIIEFLQENIHF